MRMRILSRAALAAVLVLAACAEDGGPVAPANPSPGPVLAELQCRVSTTAGTFSCGGAARGGARENLIVGNQGSHAFLAGEIVENEPGTIAISVTVTNLIPQPLGTEDGSTPHPDGVRVFFHVPPAANAGVVTVANAPGTVDYTGTGQPFFQYDQVLATNETSDGKLWRFSVSPEVTSFVFRVYVRAMVPFPGGYVDVTPAADSVDVGQTQLLSARVRNAYGDSVPGPTVVWGSSDESVATVSASGQVTAVGIGTATITATSGSRSGSATLAVCAAPAPGGVVTLEGAAAETLCLSGGASGAEYTVVPGNGATAGDLSLDVTGAGIVAVSGAPSPSRLWSRAGGVGGSLSGPLLDATWETALRQRERAEVEPRAAAARAALSRAPGARRAITPGVPAVGALMSLNTQSARSCDTPDLRTGRVAAVSTRAIILADTTNPQGGFTAAEYQAMAERFDDLVYPTVVGAFGAPTDRDGNGRVVIFFSRAINELTPPGASGAVGGFFYSRDLLPVAQCPTSNGGEMFYMPVPDPNAEVNGNTTFTRSFVVGATMATLAHEFQHLTNASRRMYVNNAGVFETAWLNEGLSHVAEELVFHAAGGTAPRGNLGAAGAFGTPAVRSAFFEFMGQNVGRYRQFLLDPSGQSPYQNDTDLATRGAIWNFLRYAADRNGGSEDALWFAMANSTTSGRGTLAGALGITDAALSTWFRDWRTSVYADDAGIGAGALFGTSSWDLRSIYTPIDYNGDGTGDGFGLAVRNPANGVSTGLALAPGGAAYLRMGVPAGGKAGLTVRSGGAAPPTHATLQVIRRK